MTIKVQNLSDLQDRRIMMEKKLPPYGLSLIHILCAWVASTQSISPGATGMGWFSYTSLPLSLIHI